LCLNDKCVCNIVKQQFPFPTSNGLFHWDQQALIQLLEQKQFNLFGCLFQKQDTVAKNGLLVAASKLGLSHVVKTMLQDPVIDPCFDDCQAILEAYLTKNETIEKLLLFDSRTAKHHSNDYLAFFKQDKQNAVHSLL